MTLDIMLFSNYGDLHPHSLYPGFPTASALITQRELLRLQVISIFGEKGAVTKTKSHALRFQALGTFTEDCA